MTNAVSRLLAAVRAPKFNAWDGGALFLSGNLVGIGQPYAALGVIGVCFAISGAWSGLTRRTYQPAQATDPRDERAVTPPSGWPQVERIVSKLLAELDRSMVLFPTWPSDPIHASNILQEEAGEVSKAVNEVVYEPHKGISRADVEVEALQTGAMAIRFLMSLNRYTWTGATQHVQLDLLEPTDR